MKVLAIYDRIPDTARMELDEFLDPEEHDGGPRRKTLHRREHLCSWRFLTFSCHQRLPLMKNAGVRDVFVDRLRAAREQHRFRLIAWVVMPEHVHLLIVPRVIVGYEDGWPLIASTSTVGRIYQSLKKSVSLRVLGRWRELRAPILPRLTLPDGSQQFWMPGGGFDRNVRDQARVWKAIRYIHSNPVERGLVERAEDWMWSSARWYATGEGDVPIDNDRGTTAWRIPDEWKEAAVRIDPRE